MTSKEEWDEILKQPFAEGETPDHWPRQVRAISFNGLSLLGIDRRGRLYWNGTEVKTESRLNWYERVLATLATLGTVSVAVFDAIRFFTAAH